MGEKLSIRDVVELAKAGYKYSEVKELLTLADSQNTESSGDHADTLHNNSDEDKQNTQVQDQNSETKEKEPDMVSSASNDNSIDYKKLYEESQKTLKEAQNANTRKDISGRQKPDDEQRLSELISSFM